MMVMMVMMVMMMIMMTVVVVTVVVVTVVMMVAGLYEDVTSVELNKENIRLSCYKEKKRENMCERKGFYMNKEKPLI